VPPGASGLGEKQGVFSELCAGLAEARGGLVLLFEGGVGAGCGVWQPLQAREECEVALVDVESSVQGVRV